MANNQTLNQILDRHNNHQAQVISKPLTQSGQPTFHAGALRCIPCQKHLKWLSQSEVDIIMATTATHAE